MQPQRTYSTDLDDCLGLDAIDRVVHMHDPVQRNLWITYIYHRLELALAGHLGGDDLSWCAYGTWASKTAGRSIRGELVPGAVRPLATSFRWLAGADARVRERIAAGNLLVFAELAPCFAALLAVLERDDSDAGLYLTGLAHGPSDRGGQDMLRRAMLTYLAAAAERDVKARSEQILLANTLVAYHEQIRLQDTIAAALSAPLALLVPVEAGLRGPIGERLGQAVRAVLTRYLMTIELPGARVHLGHDVPALACGAMFPADLEQISLPELRDLLDDLDRTPDTTDGSAANDWSELGDRMNFVVDLFRSRQRDRSLRLAPFADHQVAAMFAGRRPPGPL